MARVASASFAAVAFLRAATVGAYTPKAEGVDRYPFLGGLADDLAKVYNEEPRLAIDRALLAAVSYAADRERVPIGEFLCEKDYGQACPQGWADLGDGGNCAAPTGYDGPCAAVLDFGSLPPQGKRLRAEACGAEFSCVGARELDYEADCPVGWLLGETGQCLAPRAYDGPCAGHQMLADMAWWQKSDWGRACGVAWPRRGAWQRAQRVGVPGNLVHFSRPCVPDYSQPCPDRWEEAASVCRAPAAYSGVCGYGIAAAAFDARQKQAFAEACDAPWACARGPLTFAGA